jgi:hypothetical protein
MNMVQILSAHICKWKNDTAETIPGTEGGNKGERGKGEFKYDVFDTL